MQRIFRRALIIAICAMGSGQAGAQTASGEFVPFDQFMRGLTAARAQQFVGQPQAVVAGPAAFEEMRQHALRLYGGVHVRHSYVYETQYFDCVPINEQPSVRLLGLTNVPMSAPPPAMPPGYAANASAQHATQFDPDQQVDAFGNSTQCETGTIPMRRVTLQEMTRFGTLRQFFQKGPNGAGEWRSGQQPVEATHKYAHATQTIANHGGASNLNLWNPKVNLTRGEIFSLSQHWYVNFTSGGQVQTAELGWQNFPQKYGVAKSVLFIYWTADSYSQTGCYNLDCSAFVQTNSNVRLGGTFSKYSRPGKTQYDVKLQWQVFANSGGQWWLYFNDQPVGFYPSSLYQGGPLAASAATIDYGGETVGSTTWPKMGSGKFPAKGMGQAAFQRLIYYVTTGNTAASATLTKQQPSPHCYKIAVHNNSASAKNRTYFLFGGPGGGGC
jgi:hypothetical protein